MLNGPHNFPEFAAVHESGYVACCETAMRLELGAKRKWLSHAQNVADDPKPTSDQRNCLDCNKHAWDFSA